LNKAGILFSEANNLTYIVVIHLHFKGIHKQQFLGANRRSICGFYLPIL